ncbi:MAG: DUF2851 family protein [Chloroflexota bacterium]
MKVTEAMLSALWQRGGLLGKALLTTEGRRVRVLHPGTPDDGRGPDFIGAAIAWEDGAEARGDIELHAESQGWRQHGHHRDPRYNSVMLHVVFRHNSRGRTMLEDGKVVPVVPLEQCLGQGAAARVAALAMLPLPEPRCYFLAERTEEGRLCQMLGVLGEERFRAKAGAFSVAFGHLGHGQALYAGIMVALGYAENKAACSELAFRLPLVALKEPRGVAERQALLLGMAGLLPSQRRNRGGDDRYAAGLERTWRRRRVGDPMREGQWEFFRVRPANYPTRRLAAMGHLLGRWHGGPVAWLLDLVERAAREGSVSALEAGLVVPEDDYWSGHHDFGLRCEPSALVGRGRAAEIAVNVLLPFVLACGMAWGQAALADTVLELYHSHPALAENRISRRLGARLWGHTRRPVLRASQQQGLVHLRHTFCVLGRCRVCPLLREAEAGGDIQAEP